MSNGLLVSSDGRVGCNSVANSYAPVAGDVHIGGTLCNTLGEMYVTADANLGTDVLINGIRHSNVGVRYIDEATKVIRYPEGFAIGSDGRQGVLDAVATNFIRGIGRDNDGRMSVTLGGSVPPGNIALSNLFENSISFGTDESQCGVRLTAAGGYEFSAEPSQTPFWQSVNFGTEWIDDGGASAAQFEAQIVALNIGNAKNLQFVGWAGFNQWLPCNQTLALTDTNLDPAPSAGGFITDVIIREIATPANTVTGNQAMTCTNDF